MKHPTKPCFVLDEASRGAVEKHLERFQKRRLQHRLESRGDSRDLQNAREEPVQHPERKRLERSDCDVAWKGYRE
eukprot:CAMPEP_0180120312 /NCGR_PEP_ID=MMETSP0986-20121125/2450_1 /TAXON_ID=697907 /ORGANISM="non described non described, Strain CCMP2293" /LENGTH=74 /DNA_ID=CAMNT_0022059375 /DNA_START=178 /DNA_END=402 /DNA_ORIENTATION=-